MLNFLPFEFVFTAFSLFSAPRYPESPYTTSSSPVVNCPDIESEEIFAAHIGQVISVRLGAGIGILRYLMDAFGIDIRDGGLEHMVQRVLGESYAEELRYAILYFSDKCPGLAGNRIQKSVRCR